MTEDKSQDKWYFRSTSIVIGFLLVGPFILPLVWSNPHNCARKKIIVSIVIIAISIVLFILAAGVLKTLNNYYQQWG